MSEVVWPEDFAGLQILEDCEDDLLMVSAGKRGEVGRWYQGHTPQYPLGWVYAFNVHLIVDGLEVTLQPTAQFHEFEYGGEAGDDDWYTVAPEIKPVRVWAMKWNPAACAYIGFDAVAETGVVRARVLTVVDPGVMIYREPSMVLTEVHGKKVWKVAPTQWDPIWRIEGDALDPEKYKMTRERIQQVLENFRERSHVRNWTPARARSAHTGAPVGGGFTGETPRSNTSRDRWREYLRRNRRGHKDG